MDIEGNYKKKSVSNDILKFIALFIIYTVLLIFNGYLSVLFAYLMAVHFAISNNKSALLYFLFFTMLQNIVLVIAAPHISSSINTLFSLSKEVMIYAFVVIFAIRMLIKQRSAIKQSDIGTYVMIFALLFLILFSFINSSAGTNAKVVAIRTIFLPFICLLFGYSVRFKEEEMRRIIIVMSIIGAVISVIAFIDLIFFRDQLLNYLPLREYYINKGTPNVFTWTGLPTNYTTWDFAFLTGGISYRLISIFTDPLTLGHFSFGMAVMLDSIQWRYKRIIQFILFVTAFFTLSKGIYISFIVYFAFKILRRTSYKKARKSVLLGLCILLIFAFSGSSSLISKFSGTFFSKSSTMSHIRGLSNGFAKANIIGGNLGKAGSVVYMLQEGSEGLADVDVVENWMGGYVYQLGYIALIVYVVFYGTHIDRLLKDYWISKDKFSLSACILIICVLLESFLSESAISILGTGFFFIFAGIASKLAFYRLKELNVDRKARAIYE